MPELILSCGHPLDMAEIPDAALASEWGRRRSAKRATRAGGRNGGRKPKLSPCPKCGLPLGVVAMRSHRCER